MTGLQKLSVLILVVLASFLMFACLVEQEEEGQGPDDLFEPDPFTDKDETDDDQEDETGAGRCQKGNEAVARRDR